MIPSPETLARQMAETLETYPRTRRLDAFDPPGYPLQRALLLEGPPVDGRPTGAFAYLGIPTGPAPVPAVVLVHGGGGVAFPQWVDEWNRRGYAAIAFCHTGYRPPDGGDPLPETDAGWTREPLPGCSWLPGPDNDSMEHTTGPLERQWMFHAVSLTIRAHNLLRADPRVDAGRIGLAGISWGGVAASLALGYDRRFAFAVPVYGSACLERSLTWMGPIFSQPDTRSLWSAADRLGEVTTPVLWLGWSSDTAFSVQAGDASCALSPRGERALIEHMGHNHPLGWGRPEIYRFADAAVRGGEPLVRFGEPVRARDGRLLCPIAPPVDAREVSGRLVYIREPMTFGVPPVWESLPCALSAGMLAVRPPEDACGGYLEAAARCGDTVYLSTTRFFEKTEQEGFSWI